MYHIQPTTFSTADSKVRNFTLSLVVRGVTITQPFTQEQKRTKEDTGVLQTNTHTHTHSRGRKVEHWWVAGFPLKPAVQKRLDLQVHMHGVEGGLCTSRLLRRLNVNFGLFPIRRRTHTQTKTRLSLLIFTLR